MVTKANDPLPEKDNDGIEETAAMKVGCQSEKAPTTVAGGLKLQATGSSFLDGKMQ